MKFFQLIPSTTNIDFIGKFKIFVAFSLLTCGIVAAGFFTKGLNYGVDFTGGTVLQVKFSEPLTIDAVRALVTEAGEPDASVVAVGKESLEYMITTGLKPEPSKGPAWNQQVVEKAGAGKATVLSLNVVGPKVGKELKKAAVLSLIYTIILITIYIWFRFDIRFAPGATIAMIHDLIMATGFYIFTGHEFTITAIAALLTIAGYSVNDTIVIYDRVRELIKVGGDSLPLPETINKAINLTLSRTLLTSGITLISVIPIIIFCKGEIQDFATAMAFGIFVGSYSTIYIASPLTIYVERMIGGKQTSGRPKPVIA